MHRTIQSFTSGLFLKFSVFKLYEKVCAKCSVFSEFGFKTHHTVNYLVEKRPVFIETLKYLKNDVLLSFKQKNVQQKY